jgi:hypothetical protein
MLDGTMGAPSGENAAGLARAFSRSISSANAAQLSAMIDCSRDRWGEISLDDASNRHSAAYFLHCFALIIAISPI